MSKRRSLFVLPVAMLVSAGAWAVTPSVTVGTASGPAGTAVNIPITFDPGVSAVAGVQFNLTLPSGVSTGPVTAGAGGATAGKRGGGNLYGTTWTFFFFWFYIPTKSAGNI